MSRMAIGAVCVDACVFITMNQRARQALGTFALEQVERMFDVVETVLNDA